MAKGVRDEDEVGEGTHCARRSKRGQKELSMEEAKVIERGRKWSCID